MTDDRLLRQLNEMLDGLPKVAPDRLLASVLDDIETGSQSRGRVSAYDWRRLVSNLARRQLAAGAVLIAVLGLIALDQIDRSPGTSGAGVLRSPSPTPVPTASAEQSQMPSPTARAMSANDYQVMSPPGRYDMPEPNTDGVGAWPADQVIVTVPGGWTQNGQWRGGGIVKHLYRRRDGESHLRAPRRARTWTQRLRPHLAFFGHDRRGPHGETAVTRRSRHLGRHRRAPRRKAGRVHHSRSTAEMWRPFWLDHAQRGRAMELPLVAGLAPSTDHRGR
jgi:hypothetical protein